MVEIAKAGVRKPDNMRTKSRVGSKVTSPSSDLDAIHVASGSPGQTAEPTPSEPGDKVVTDKTPATGQRTERRMRGAKRRVLEPATNGESAARKRRKKDSHVSSFLGIDMGSSAIRATILKKEGASHEFFDVRDVDCPPQEAVNGWQYQFPTAIDPGPRKGLIGHAAVQSPSSVSLKFFMYELARVHHAGDAKITECIEKQLKNTFKDEVVNSSGSWDKVVVGKVRNLIVDYFTKIRQAVTKLCSEKYLIYDSIAVTIPASAPFQAVYAEILEEVWPHISKENIVCIFEAEAIGHYLLHDHGIPGATTLQKLNSKYRKPYDVMVIDFGGHTINGASFHLKWDETEGTENTKPAFYSIEPAWGTPGGAEFYSKLVEEAIRRDRTNIAHPKKEERVRQLMNSFKLKQSQLADAPFVLLSEHGNWELTDTATAKALYDQAFRGPLDLAHSKIRERGNEPTLVFLIGGSYWNNAAREETLKLLNQRKRLGWRQHVFHDQQHVSSMGMVVAQGAALALAHSMSVADSLASGSAFAMYLPDNEQNKQTPSPILLHNGTSTTIQYVLEEEQTFRIVCDPYHEASAGGSTLIDDASAYDFVTLGSRSKGTYEFSLKHTVADGEDFMVLKEIARGQGAKVQRNLKIPVYFDAGQRVVMANRDLFDEKKLEWK